MDNYNPPNMIKYKKFWIYDNFFLCKKVDDFKEAYIR